MKIVYLSNYFNHHQRPLSNELYKALGDNYHFVETSSVPAFRKELGYEELSAPYLLKYNSNTSKEIDLMINEADVVIYGEAPLSIIKYRYESGKLTLRDDESRYKNPNRYLKWPIYTYHSHWINKGYLLCASAYAPIDYRLSGMDRRKCFRWGYYTELKRYDLDTLLNNKRIEALGGVSILWAGRLIGLKHPDAVFYVARHLKRKNVHFKINIIGTGPLESDLKRKIKYENLTDNVFFLGAMTPETVRSYMEKASIFLFTSDRREGWGAVLNEAMNSGCAVVADGNIGSVPFLVEDGVNGIVYKSKNWSDLCKKIEWLSRHPNETESLGRMAYKTMEKIWNAENAAHNLIELCESLMKGNNTPIKSGPCSQAPLLLRTWKGIVKSL